VVLCQLCQSDTELGVSYAAHDVRGSGCIVTSVFGNEKNLAEKRWALSDASSRATERARCSNRPMLQRLLDSVSCSSRARLIEKRTPRQCKSSPAAARTLVSQLVNHASKGHHSNWPPAPLLLSCWASRWPIMVVASRYRFEQLERQLLSELLSRVPGLEMHFSKQSAVTLSATFHKPRLSKQRDGRGGGVLARGYHLRLHPLRLSLRKSLEVGLLLRREGVHRKHRRKPVSELLHPPCTHRTCEKTLWF
jgi:hypothetical protein